MVPVRHLCKAACCSMSLTSAHQGVSGACCCAVLDCCPVHGVTMVDSQTNACNEQMHPARRAWYLMKSI